MIHQQWTWLETSRCCEISDKNQPTYNQKSLTFYSDWAIVWFKWMAIIILNGVIRQLGKLSSNYCYGYMFKMEMYKQQERSVMYTG